MVQTRSSAITDKPRDTMLSEMLYLTKYWIRKASKQEQLVGMTFEAMVIRTVLFDRSHSFLLVFH